MSGFAGANRERLHQVEIREEQNPSLSRSFAIILRETRESTPDPERPGKMLTQLRMADILGVAAVTYRRYEWDKRLPHPIIRREIFRLFPSISSPV